MIVPLHAEKADNQKFLATRKNPSITKDCFFFVSGFASLGFSALLGAAARAVYHEVEDREVFAQHYIEDHKVQTAVTAVRNVLKTNARTASEHEQPDPLARRAARALLDRELTCLSYAAASFYSGALGIYLIGKALHVFNSHPEIIKQESK